MTFDLNDVRHFLAVARMGSTQAAARTLGVNQTTCARRIAALEQALDLRLFERAASGYAMTAGGEALVPAAERVEAASDDFLRAARAQRRIERAEIRFSTSDVLADLVGGPALARFAAVCPEISVTLHVDSRAVDLGADEADVALRAATSFDDSRLVVRKVMDTPWAFYAAADARLQVAPQSLADLSRHPLVTLEGRPAEMLRRALPGASIRFVSNSMKALIDVIAGGECLGALPEFVGERQPGLRRCFGLDVDAGGLWIVFPEWLKGAPHIRVFVDHLAAFMRTLRR